MESILKIIHSIFWSKESTRRVLSLFARVDPSALVLSDSLLSLFNTISQFFLVIGLTTTN
jgi:hypothetical protein